MSVDFQLAWPCPHLTLEEVVELDSDRRTLETRQPIASSGQVRVLINDNLFVPRGGLGTPALLYASSSAPYDMMVGEDVLTVETSSGSGTLSFGVSSNSRLTLDQVLKSIQSEGWDHVEVTSENGYLVFADTSRVGSYSFVKVSGSASVSLGFGRSCGPGVTRTSDAQRAAWGKDLYPGWSLYQKPDTVTNRFIRFNAPLKGNPVIKVNYAVPVQRCLRCRATFVENDIRFDASGDVIVLQNEDLLYQSALKMLLTDRGSNPYFPWYGTTIRERIGSKAVAGVASVLSEEVRRTLSKMQSLQSEQSKYQQVSFKEKLYSVLSVNVKRHQQDLSTFLIEVAVQNASGQPVELNVVFTVPEVVALMGRNGLMLGTEPAGV